MESKEECKDCNKSLEHCTCIEDTIDFPKQEPKKVLTEEDIFNQKDIDAVTDYINKEQQKQHLIDMMESDEELELYDESREIKLKDVFNDEKKENIKKFIDEIENPSEPNQALIDAAERYIAGDNYNRYYDDFIEGAKWQEQQNDTSKVKRVEVIQHSPPYNGRAFTKYNAKDVEIQFQDDGRTLKIFLK
jgi:hypothetical protein